MTSAVVVLLWMTAWCCARGATVRWTAPVGGSWSQQGNWEGQEVPGSEDDVIIELDEVVKGYRSLGCWRDSSNRAIPILEGTDPRLDGHYQARVNATDKCFRVARSRGFSVFAVQNGGQCFGSAEGHNTYTRYGARSSSDCGEDGEGGYYASSVYQIKAFPITVRVDSNTEIRNLHTFPNITLDVVSSLTVNGNMQVDGHLKLYTSNSNEGITVGKTARVRGSFQWMAGKFNSPAQGQLHIEETMQMNLNWGSRNLDTRLSGTELYIHGEAVIDGGSASDRLYLSEGGKLIVTEGATLNMTGILSLLKESTGTLVNNGSMKIHSTGTVTVAPTIYNTGDVQVLKGTFSCTGSTTWRDAIWISTGATLKLSGGTHTLQHTSTVLGSGNMDVGSRVTVSSQNVQVGDILVSSGTLDLYTASSGLTVAKIDVASRGVFNIHSHGNSSDWLALRVPEVILRSNNYDYEISTLNCERALQVERLHMTAGRHHAGLLLKVMGDVVITDSWNWNGGTIQSRGPVSVNGPLMIEGDASGTAAVPELYLNGPVTTRGAQTVNINHGGTVVNRVGNVVSIRGNLNLRGNGRFLNYGEVKVEQPSPGTASISLSSFDNFGGTTVSGTPGSGLSISINHGLTGTYHVSENNVLTIVGPSTHIGRVLKDAVLTGGGTLQVNGPEVGFKSIQVSDVSITAGTVYIGSEQRQRIPSLKVTRGLVVLDESSSTTKIDDLVVTGGEVTFNRPTTIQDLEIRSGVLSGDSDITVNGTFVWTGGTLSGRLGSRITVNGKMHVAPSGTLNLNRNLVLKGKSDWVTTNLNLVLTRAFEISPGASLCVHGGGMSFTSSSSDENGAVLNYGDFIIDASYQDLRINTQLRNYAVIQIQHGNLLLQRSSVMVGAMMNSTDKSKVVISGGNHEITSSGTTGIQEWKHTLEVNSGSLWSKDTIWSTMSVNGGDVHIDLSGGSASMDSISVTRGTLDITSTTPSSAVPTLTVQNSITVTYGQLKLLGANCKAKHMTVSHQNARVEIERNLEIEDTFHWDAGTLAGTAFADCEISRTSVLGTLTVTGDSTRYLKTQSMFIHGSGQWFGQGELRLDSSAELVITEGATFQHHGGGTYSSQDHLARVVNRGTYELFPHSDVNMNVKLQNTGQLRVPDTATLSFRADSQLRGQLQADKGSVLQLLEGSHVLIDEASTFRGKLSSTSPFVVFYSNRSVEDIEVGGGQIRLLTHFSSMRVLKLTVNGGHVTVEPSRIGNSQTELSVDNVELVSGTLELNVQTRIGYLSQKGGSIRGSFDIFVEEFEWSGGSVVGELNSQLLVEDLECRGTGTKTLQQRSLILQSSGTFVGDAAGVIDINGHGNFVIAKDAQVVATAGVTIQSDLGMFENRGMLINALQGNGKMLAVSGHFRNTGTVECLDDTMMKVSGTGKWEGVLTTGSNATLELADGHQLFLSSFEVNGTGKLEVSSGSVSMQTCSISGAVMQISAPVYVQGEDHCFIQSLRVTENGVFISHSAATIELVQQIGGVVRALSSLTVAEYDLAGGTLQSHNVTEVDRLQWSSGAVTGGKLYVGVVTLSQGTDKVASRAAITVSRRCIWAEGFEETLGLQENSVLIITQEASMEVESVATLSSETGDSYQGRLENHGQINVKQTLRSSAEFVNFGNISISESKLTVTTKSENRGYIGIGKTSEVELRDHFSYPSSVIEGDGKLTLTQGTARLSTDTLKQKTLHVTGATVTIASTTGHDFSPQEVIITGGQADFVGNKGDTFELESLTIAGGRVKIHNPCNISQLTMTGGSLSIMAPTEITTFDFFAGQLVGLSELGYLTIHTLTLHNQKTRDDTEKVLQSLLIDIHRKVRWLPPSKDTMRMQDGSKIRLLSDCETTLQGQLEFQGSSETIENYGILTVYGSDEDLPHMKTSIRIDPHFNNVGTVRVQETSMVSFQSTAQISGSLTAHRNATVEFVNHHSTTPQNIKGGRLTVQNSNLWIPSTNTFTALNINLNGHVNFVSNATDPVHDSVFEEVNLRRGSVTFASDVSIAVLEIIGGTVESTTPNGVVQAQQMTCQEDTESSNVQSCHVTAGDVRFVGSTVTMMSSSLRIQHSGIARSSVQVDMSNSSVLVSEGTTLAVKHKMAFRKTGLGESTLEVAGMVLVEGSQFVTSAAVVLPNTGNFTVTKDFSELDIHSTGRSAGSFNIRGSHSTITSRGPGDLVLDKGSFIGPNATINVQGGHTVITGIEHQLLENSGLRITLQGTGMMTLNSSELSETPNPLTVNEVTLRSLSSKLFLSEAAPKIQKIVVVEGQVYGDAEFGTVILQSNIRLADCNLDVDHLIISGNNNDNKEMQASKINVLASLRLEADATIAMSQGSVLRLAPSAICSMDNALEITASDVDSAASWFINEGRMTVKLGAGREASIGAKFNHSGELVVEDGHLTMTNDSFIRGRLQVNTGSRLTLSSGVHRIESGSSCLVEGSLIVESAAFVEMESDDISIESATSHGTVSLRGETCISGLELADGHFEVGGNAGIGALDMSAATLSVRGDVTVNGPVKWQSGTIQLSAGSSLTVNGDFTQAISEGQLENQGGTFTISPANPCGAHTDCTSCQGAGDCSWYPTANLCVQNAIAGPSTCSARNCLQKLACSNFGTTEACSSQPNCTWCLASDMCVQSEQCPSAAAFWSSSAGGEWHTASNWFNDTIPGESSEAFLASLSEDYEVRITTPVTVEVLEIGSQCDHAFNQGCDTTQTLNVQRDLQVGRLLVRRNARLIFSGDNLIIGSSLTVEGAMEWRKGTIRGNGNVNLMGTLTIPQDCYYCSKNLQVPLENYGRITLQTTRNALTMSAQVNITNVGEILIKSSGVVNGGTIYNEGLIFSTTPTATINSNMVQNGKIFLRQSTLQLGGNAEFSGATIADEDSELLLKSGIHTFAFGSTLPSSLTMDGGTTVINTTGNAIKQLHLKNSATLQSDQDLLVDNVFLERGSLLGRGDYQINTFSWREGTIEGMKSISVTREMTFLDDSGDPAAIHTTFVQDGAMYTTTNTNLHLYGQSILQGNVTIGENADVNFRGGSQHHILSNLILDDSSTLNVFDSNTVLNVSTDDLRLSKINVNSEGGRIVLFSRSDAGSVNRLELRSGSVQIGTSQLTTDEIFLTTGEISGNDAHVWTRKATLHDTDDHRSFVRVANLTVSEKLLISKSYPSNSRQVTIDSCVTILPSATLVAVTRFTMYGEGEIVNEGNFRIDSNDDQWLDIRLGFVNHGHLQVTNRLVFNNGGSNHGEIRMVPTSKLYLRSSKVYNMTSAGEIFGSGTIYMDTDDPVVYLSGKDDSMESSGKDIGLVVSRGRCYADFRQAHSLVQRISISRDSIEITASASNPPHIAEVNFLPDYNYNTFFTCATGTGLSIGKLTLRQYRSSGHFGHGCGVVTSNMIWSSGVINRPAYFYVIGHLDIKHASGYKRIVGTNMSITATAVADADSAIYMADESKIDINGSFSSYSNLRFQKEGSGTPQLVISGHVRLLQRGKSMTVTSGVSLVNYGTIEVLHGTLSIPSTDCHSGTFVVAKGALLQFNSGVTQVGSDCSFEVFSASISGNSRLDVVDTKSIPQYITISSGTLVLNPNSNTTVDTLNVNGNVEISGQFRVRKFNLNSGNMEVNGLVIITDEMAWSGGNLMSNQMHIDGNLYLTSSSTKYLRSGTLVATGTVSSKDSQTLQMQGDAVFDLQGSMGVQDSLRIAGSGQNAFLNAGIIKVQAGLNEYGLIVDVNFDSPGVIMVESGKMKVGHSNRDVASTLHGNITVKEQALLEMGYGEFTFANQSLLNVSGTMSISSAQVQVYSSESTVTINNVKVTSSGTLETSAKDVMIRNAEICSGTLWFHRSAKIDTLQLCGGRLRPGRSVNVTELMITSGDVFSSSARPKIIAGRMGWGGGRIWANEDTTTMTVQVNERLHVFGSGSKYGDYDTVIRVDGQFTMISVGNLYLSRSALIQLDGESTASLHHGYIRTQYSPPGRFTNMGDITIGEYSKATTVALHVPFQMLGKIAIKQGQLNIASGGRFSGSTELFMDGRLEVTGAVSDTLTVSSDVELHGKLAVSWNSDGPTPSNMDTFPIIAYGGSCRIDGLVTVSVHDNVNFNTTCGDSFITVTVLR
ncbi:uncharacterized protein LOC118432806 [Branchiostoma floridae]|uniref:Uncharacterized protein LOC118432806 n=1 Tax=Branchiostoma floridae TaxID=7739 RepID=A0A9J7MFJ5_BRAFL|nr:uncharacterized protein LOC118432806 [Branchiostoma floridae]